MFLRTMGSCHLLFIMCTIETFAGGHFYLMKLLELFEEVYERMDEGTCRSRLLDFAKASDKVLHVRPTKSCNRAASHGKY